MQQDHGVNAVLSVPESGLCSRVVQVPGLGFQQTDDDVQVILYPVVDLQHKEVFLREQLVLLAEQLLLSLVLASDQQLLGFHLTQSPFLDPISAAGQQDKQDGATKDNISLQCRLAQLCVLFLALQHIKASRRRLATDVRSV